jgi:thiol:disulfide interchange protein DsbC
MKRISLAAALAATSLFAATDAQIIEYFKGQVPENISITITERQELENAKGFDRVSTTLSDGTQSQVINIYVKDGLLFPDIIDLKTGKSAKQTFEKAQAEQKLGAIYKTEDSKNIVSLGNDENKETLVVFSDPECPYCRAELGQIENRLKEVNIKLILTPVHERTSLEKSYLIYQEVAKAKTDEEKIAILRKYFDENLKTLETKVSDEAVASMEELRRKYLSGSIKGVPYIVEEAALLR